MRAAINEILLFLGLTILTDDEFNSIVLPDPYTQEQFYKQIYNIIKIRGNVNDELDRLYFYFFAKGETFDKVSANQSKVYLGQVINLNNDIETFKLRQIKKGDKGLKGDKGDTGEKGDKGDKGDSGEAISTYESSFTIGSWLELSPYYYIDITHNLETAAPQVSCYDSNNEEVFLERIEVISNNLIKIFVSSIPDSRFIGIIRVF